MPLFDYKCGKCKHEFEVFFTSQSVVKKEEAKEKCPQCGSLKKRKVISKGTSHILRGKGWAKDRYS